MGNMVWGLLGREPLGAVRRTRTLGLGAAVRNFNELAVPGMGGVWFGRQIFLATLGIAVGELARQEGSRSSNIAVANALEALGCWHAIVRGGEAQDARVRGREKLPRQLDDLPFARFSQPSFYVTQPMRMQTVQALLELGLVKSSGQRFNSYSMAPAGHAFLEAAFRELPCPFGAAHLTALQNWVCGSDRNMNTNSIRLLLSPAEPLPHGACGNLRDLLVRGGSEAATRRRNLLEWFEELRLGRVKLDARPSQLSAVHWHEVQAGRLFFLLQAAAFAVLDTVEVMLAKTTAREIALSALDQAPVRAALVQLRDAAAAYLLHDYADKDATGANTFAQACTGTSDVQLIGSLVRRDERVLRLRDTMVLPGAAFSDDAQLAETEEGDAETPAGSNLPAGLSYRINNLYLLNLDLNGALVTEMERQRAERND